LNGGCASRDAPSRATVSLRRQAEKPEGPRSDSRRHRVGRLGHRLTLAGMTRPVSGIGPILSASRSRAWARLGPLSVKFVLRPASHRRFGADGSLGVAHPMGWRGGFPTGRPWGFAFGSSRSRSCLIGAMRAPLRRSSVRDRHVPSGASKPRLPDPFLGSPALRHPLPGDCGGAGSDASRVGELSSRGAKRHVRRR
jgi:hypothetical protein